MNNFYLCDVHVIIMHMINNINVSHDNNYICIHSSGNLKSHVNNNLIFSVTLTLL